MNHLMPIRLVALLALAGLLAGPVRADQILKDKDLSEKNLVDALTPAAAPAGAGAAQPGADSDDVTLRSIRVKREQPSAKVMEQVAKAPPKRNSASVLITFLTNSSDLAESAKSSLDVVARALHADQLTNYKFVIEGHADPRGNPDDNLRLSQARAVSVVNYLADQHQISRDRLKPVGKGDTELLNSRQPDAAENRRVTIVTLVE